jgi:hypothetical protein
VDKGVDQKRKTERLQTGTWSSSAWDLDYQRWRLLKKKKKNFVCVFQERRLSRSWGM